MFSAVFRLLAQCLPLLHTEHISCSSTTNHKDLPFELTTEQSQILTSEEKILMM